MSTRSKILAAGAVSGLTMVTATWLVYSEHSPLHDYAVRHGEVGNALGTLNLPAVFAGVAASGNVHQPSALIAYLAVFVQWALLGSVVAWIVARLRSSSHASEGDA